MRKIIALAAIISMFFLVMSRCASFVAPSVSWVIAMAGLAFPVIWLMNFALVSLLVITGLKRVTIIMFALLLLTLPMMLKYYGIHLHKNNSSSPYAILSYNVFGFSVPGSKTNQFENMDSIHAFVNSEDFTIACFQEYPMKGAKHAQFYDKMINDLLLKHKHISEYNPQERGTRFTLLTASQFPIVNEHAIEYLSEPFAIYSDIAFPEDTIRVYNVHLQSIKLTSERQLLNFSDERIKADNFVDHASGAVLKLRIAFLHRENQVARLIESLSESPHPVILVGDFNDTPVSYTLARVSQGIRDASVLKKNGFYRTYKLSTFPLKIDHILHDKKVKVTAYRQYYSPVSDHLPVSCNFSISD